jgi:hypothetical protein
VGAARAAGVSLGGLEDYSESVSSLDKVSEVSPLKATEPYRLAYEKWKIELKYKLNKLIEEL